MLKTVSYFFLFTITLLIIAYTGVWFYFAGKIDQEVRAFMAQQEKLGIEFNGDLSYPTGFPGKYIVRYSGDITGPGGSISLPLLRLKGLPLEGETINVDAPMGLSIDNEQVPPDLRKLEQASLSFNIPENLPQELTRPQVKIWQRAGKAELTIPSILMRWQDASLYGDIVLGLDQDLQLEGQAQVGVVNYTFFLDIASELTAIEERQKFLISSFLSALDKTHGAVSLPFYIRDGGFYLNMIRLAPVPYIRWPEAGSYTNEAE